jgi:hypothetical protein
MKQSTTVTAIAIGAVIAVCIVAVCLYFLQGSRPSIDDIWFINMDKDVDRKNYLLTMAAAFDKPAQRWPATNGRAETIWAAAQEGVSTFLTKGTDEDTKNSKLIACKKPGVIGVWLSQKRLLRHLASLPVSPQYGHLILEDDVIVPTDFMSQWNAIRQRIPRDWDMIYLGTGGTHGDRIDPQILRWKNDKYAANWGAYAYIVRHGALPFMLEQLKYMDSPIDVQYYRRFTPLHIYIVDPPLITTGDLPSVIGAH